MKMVKWYSFFLIGISFFSLSCGKTLTDLSSSSNFEKWLHEDIRSLDPIDAPVPQADLIAAYSRYSGDMFEIRLDFLEMIDLDQYGLEIHISSDQISSATSMIDPALWDYHIVINPTSEGSWIESSSGKVITEIEISQVPDMDFLSILIPMDELKLEIMGDLTDLHIFCEVIDRFQHNTLDKIGPFSPYTQTEIPRIPLLISFWDVFSSSTPAQALRSWDGAHSGPFGSRHGLNYLLNSVKKYKVPVVLLDLKEPSNLQVLDYMNVLDDIRQMNEDNLLLLPDTAYGHNPQKSLVINREISNDLKLADSWLLYSNANWSGLPDRMAVFAVSEKDNRLLKSPDGISIIPLPASYRKNTAPFSDQSSLTDPFKIPLAFKKQMMDVAISDSPHDFVNFGESFAKSALGDPSIAEYFFAYLANHPWIQPLSEDDLLTLFNQDAGESYSGLCQDILCSDPLPAVSLSTIFGSANQGALDYPEMVDEIHRTLDNLPQNQISRDAWLMYQKYLAPNNSEMEHRLQANYLGQIGHLVKASEWLEKPGLKQECSDIDWDGIPECIMSNQFIFTSFEIEGGRLLYMYINNHCGTIPIITPFSQYSVGLSDPNLWELDRGYLGDPGEVSGFLADNRDLIGNYSVEISNNSLEFYDEANQIRKKFTFGIDDLAIEVNYPIETEVIIPVPADVTITTGPGPDITFYQEGKFKSSSSLNENNQLKSACLTIEIPGQDTRIISYLESFELIQAPEDPDKAYPPGHYLPFPFQSIQFNNDKRQTLFFDSLN